MNYHDVGRHCYYRLAVYCMVLKISFFCYYDDKDVDDENDDDQCSLS